MTVIYMNLALVIYEILYRIDIVMKIYVHFLIYVRFPCDYILL